MTRYGDPSFVINDFSAHDWTIAPGVIVGVHAGQLRLAIDPAVRQTDARMGFMTLALAPQEAQRLLELMVWLADAMLPGLDAQLDTSEGKG